MANKSLKTISIVNKTIIGILVLYSLLILFFEFFTDNTPLIVYLTYVSILILMTVFTSMKKKYLREIGLLKTYGRNKNITNSLIISFILGILLILFGINQFLENSEITFTLVTSCVMFYMSYYELSAHYVEINQTVISKLNERSLPIKKIETVDFLEDNNISINTAKKSIIVDLKKLNYIESTKLQNDIQEIIKENNKTNQSKFDN